MKACLGIDTSCYTTSVALCGAEQGAADGPFFQERKLLAVRQGERGLRQSEALFQHIAALPDLVQTLCDAHREAEIVAVCASVKPRPQPEAYMPVFLAGESTGRSIAAALNVPFLWTSHQQGHLRAARVDTQMPADEPYLALHLSGGTTELLHVQGEAIERLGGTRDLHAGQLVDRAGVALGLPFPAGPSLERLAMAGEAKDVLSANVRGADCHFSGAEAQVLRWIAAQALSPQDIAAEVFACITRTVARMILAGYAQRPCRDILLAGGVACSSLLRQGLRQRIAKRNHDLRLHFGRPELSGDNAVGVGLIGIEQWHDDERRRRQNGG